MADDLPLPADVAGRRIRAHRKSRRGCGNCKLRRVKCDESKPRCKKCIAYGVFCNYDCKYSDLQLSADGVFNIEPKQGTASSTMQSVPGGIYPSLRQQWMVSLGNNSSYQFGERDLELLTKFQGRTVLTVIADKTLLTYQEQFVQLAFIHPFLMHTILATTQMHDRFLSASMNAKLSPTEAFHWYQSIALFNSKLSGPIENSERDALWPAAFLLGIVAFCYVEASTPEEAWPLKPASSLDLNWLRMSDGKKEILKIAQPWRVDSLYHAWALEYSKKPPPSRVVAHICPSGARPEGLSSEFIKLYSLDTTSIAERNPYQSAASILVQSLYIDQYDSTNMNFFSFITDMQPDYRRMLELKDARALLLLAYWYAKICQSQRWWVSQRAAIECQATCIYLEKYHRYEPEIQNLLQYPRRICGIVGDSDEG